MIDLLAIVGQPLVIFLAAVALFAGMIILQARRLRSAAKDPDLAKLLASMAGTDSLKLHKQALDRAKGETAANLASAKKSLRDYTGVFKRSKRRKS